MHKACLDVQKAMKYCQRIWDEYYILKMDIAKYFDNINKNILLNILKRKIKDKDVLWLIEEILSTDLLGKNVAIPVQTLKLSGTILLITSIVMIALYYIIKLFQKKNITTRNSQQI